MTAPRGWVVPATGSFGWDLGERVPCSSRSGRREWCARWGKGGRGPGLVGAGGAFPGVRMLWDGGDVW